MSYQGFLNKLGVTEMSLINEFIYTFMRFEYTLKGSHYFVIGSVDWVRFANTISLIFDKNKTTILQESVDFLLSDSPKKQIIDDGNLVFSPSAVNYPHDAQNLDVYIRRVRNNLFHGGKFKEESDSVRDLKLINASLIV